MQCYSYHTLTYLQKQKKELQLEPYPSKTTQTRPPFDYNKGGATGP